MSNPIKDPSYLHCCECNHKICPHCVLDRKKEMTPKEYIEFSFSDVMTAVSKMNELIAIMINEVNKVPKQKRKRNHEDQLFGDVDLRPIIRKIKKEEKLDTEEYSQVMGTLDKMIVNIRELLLSNAQLQQDSKAFLAEMEKLSEYKEPDESYDPFDLKNFSVNRQQTTLPATMAEAKPPSICDLLDHLNYKYIDLDETPLDMCELPNESFAIVSETKLTLYDSEFNIFAMITNFGNKNTVPLEVAFNYRKELYVKVMDKNLQKVIIMAIDNKTYKMKYATGNVDATCSIASCNDNQLYVASREKRFVKIYDPKLRHVKDFNIDFLPHQIKISNGKPNFLCVFDRNIHFYNLNSGKLVSSYNIDRPGVISFSFEAFFLVSYDADAVFIQAFNEEGNHGGSKQTQYLQELLSGPNDGRIILFTKTFILSSSRKRLYYDSD